MFGREAPVAAGPGDWAAAGGKHGHLRASYTDREHVISTLKAAFVQGRLTMEELDERVGRALVSRTYRDLAALTADIPAGLAPAPSRRAGSPDRRASRRVARAAAFVAIGPAVLVAAFDTSNEAVFKWLIAMMIIYYMALMVAGAVMLDTWQQGPPGGQPPLRPAGRCRAIGGERRGRAGGGDLSLFWSRGHGARIG
jgi:hypothetical protein